MPPTSTLLLDGPAIAALLDPAPLFAVLRQALIDLSAGRVSAPPRIAVRGDAGLLAAMPAADGSAMGCKLVSVFPANRGGPHPSHQALIVLFDGAHGSPLAVLEGAAITAFRTAAVSALTIRALAPADAVPGVLAVLGAGVQARAHLRLAPLARRFREIRVAGRTPARAAALAAEFGARACGIEEAVRGADVVCACTDAAVPVLRREWLRPGAHVTSVGIGGCELDPATLDAARLLLVESRVAFDPFPAGAHELQGRDRAAAVELGELLGAAAPPIPAGDGPSVYKSVGHAVEDTAVAAWIHRRALAENRGREFDFAAPR